MCRILLLHLNHNPVACLPCSLAAQQAGDQTSEVAGSTPLIIAARHAAAVLATQFVQQAVSVI